MKKAARYNSGKTQLHFTLPLLVDLESHVSAFGSVKYASFNWIQGGDLTTPLNCLKRHTDAIHRGEWLDDDSGLPHAAHIRWNAGQMIHWYYTDEIIWDDSNTPQYGVMNWNLPVIKYTSQLETDLELARKNYLAAEKKYMEERRKAGLV
jgi:hypothetical protein